MDAVQNHLLGSKDRTSDSGTGREDNEVAAASGDGPGRDPGCLGIIRLSKQYGADRVETAAIRALAANVTSYKSLKSILDCGLDKAPMKDERAPALRLAFHSNVRGRDYYN